MTEKIGFNLPAEMLGVLKIKILDDMKNGRTETVVSCELLLGLVERAEAWTRLEADERVFDAERND